MKKKFSALINKEDNWYVAHCVEVGVVSQGKTFEEAQINLKEAVELHLESFDVEEALGSDNEIKARGMLTNPNLSVDEFLNRKQEDKKLEK